MSEKLCLVLFCDVCGRMLHEAIGCRIEGKDYCLECAGKCLNRHDRAEPVCASKTEGCDTRCHARTAKGR